MNANILRNIHSWTAWNICIHEVLYSFGHLFLLICSIQGHANFWMLMNEISRIQLASQHRMTSATYIQFSWLYLLVENRFLLLGFLLRGLHSRTAKDSKVPSGWSKIIARSVVHQTIYQATFFWKTLQIWYDRQHIKTFREAH